MNVDRESLAGQLRVQAGHCRSLGSPLYEDLLLRAADDVVGGGPVWRLFEGREDAPADSAPLALIGAVHRLVLSGGAPALARWFPSASVAAGREPGPVDGDAAWREFLRVVEGRRNEVAALLDHPIQTNEVGRSAALLGGFLEVARTHPGLPLRLAEIGASAGLNLRWDRYRYEGPGWSWGEPGSPVVFPSVFEGADAPPADAPVSVAERLGCDRAPVDPTTEDGRLTLMSYVWADQVERFARLRGALEVARRVPATVERADAFDWLERRLPRRRPGRTTVVFHSVVTLYFTPDQRERLAGMLADAGGSATADEPLAWLRFEHPDTGDPTARGWARLGKPEVRLTTWPGGEDRLLAVAAAHGPPVRWLGG
ncbi:MAG: DUF2332 domain-containing protein [Actinomycetota bacterium]